MQFTLDKKHPSSFPFVSTMASALVERERNGGGVEILLQTRANKNDAVYYGTFELPAGHIDKFENIYDAVAREVLEETGLTITEFLGDERTEEFSTREADAAFGFKPFLCQQYLRGPGWSWIGFVFRCRAEGTLKEQAGETTKHRWVALEELKRLIEDDPSRFFTLQLPVLHYYLRFHEKKTAQRGD